MASPEDPNEPYIDPDDYTSEHVTSVSFTADLGPERQLATIADVVHDMATLVDLGALRFTARAKCAEGNSGRR